MNIKNKYVEVVNQIPVDQTARATPIIKNFLLKKVNEIIERKQFLEKTAISKRKEEVLDAYKKSIGADKKIIRLEKLEEEKEKIKDDLNNMGITTDGFLMELYDKPYGKQSKDGTYVYNHKTMTYSKLTDDQAEKVKKVRELIKAVEGEMEPFDTYEQLTARMMMASTVGETMAIVNALVGEDVFKIDKAVLELTNG